MLKNKLIEQLRNENHYVVPKYLFKYSKDLKLDINSLMLLIYLINSKNKDAFDYKKIMEELNFTEEEIFTSISSLKEKKLVSIEMVKNESGILEEIVNVDSFYDIAFSKMLDEDDKETNNSDIYDTFEKEFGRTLSPMEYEIINGWLESKLDKDLILAALKETIFNGVNNLRYVDKILYEWNKKGIKKPSDVQPARKKEEESSKTEMYEYDWLNE